MSNVTFNPSSFNWINGFASALAIILDTPSYGTSPTTPNAVLTIAYEPFQGDTTGAKKDFQSGVSNQFWTFWINYTNR